MQLVQTRAVEHAPVRAAVPPPLTPHLAHASDFGSWLDSLDSRTLSRFIKQFFGDENLRLQEEMFRFMNDDLFRPKYGLGLYSTRDLTLERLKKVASKGFIHAKDVVENPRRFMAGMQCLHYVDYTFSIKAGVHFTLCGGSIAKLGTKKQHDKYLPKLDSLELPGCYGMTELGHGSNVMGLETIATYEPTTKCFDIVTPTNLASKFWIGGSAQHGKLCAVFAQLYLNDAAGKPQWYGPHVFLVRLRDNDGNLMPGVRIKDCGAKMGLQGVDNGQIWFDHVKVPLDDMLDRYSQVSPDGKFSSSLPSVQQRFGAMVGGLTTGRYLIAAAAVDACKFGLIIAIRYSTKRTQFGDQPIMQYITHQRRLVPALAVAYGLELAMQQLCELVCAERQTAEIQKEVHVLSCGLKAMATWQRTHILQDCRECCGGMGFLAENQIGPLMTDMNVDTTFEGDNTVLMQQVVKALLGTSAATTDVVTPHGAQLPIPAAQHSRLMYWYEHQLLKQLQMAGPKKFEDNLDMAVELGKAHTERRVLEIFQARAVSAGDAHISAALLDLARLFGMWCVEQRLGFYTAHGALSHQDALGLREQLNSACRAMSAKGAKGLLSLCEGFGIPAQFITAPIAHDWTKINARL